jgi:formylglycine-generating enzyme required for sulfatase activity
VKSEGYAYSGGETIGQVAWYDSNSGGADKSVGMKFGNELGLFDMSGNVQEWCWDAYSDDASIRRFRGGSWDITENDARVATRLGNYSVEGRSPNLGFRVVRAASAMVTVVGGTLPESSVFAGQSVGNFEVENQEVTWGLWKLVRAWAVENGYDLANLGAGSADSHPVRNVTWYDAVKWCNARSEMEGRTPAYVFESAEFDGPVVYREGKLDPMRVEDADGYRLPTEIEWEWAARGGTSSKGYTYSGGDDLNLVGWYYYNSGGGTRVVGGKLANELGLNDMSGNVWEWCFDQIYGANRVVRGGSWNSTAGSCTVAARNGSTPTSSDTSLGFRVASSSVPVPSLK